MCLEAAHTDRRWGVYAVGTRGEVTRPSSSLLMKRIEFRRVQNTDDPFKLSIILGALLLQGKAGGWKAHYCCSSSVGSEPFNHARQS